MDARIPKLSAKQMILQGEIVFQFISCCCKILNVQQLNMPVNNCGESGVQLIHLMGELSLAVERDLGSGIYRWCRGKLRR